MDISDDPVSIGAAIGGLLSMTSGAAAAVGPIAVASGIGVGALAGSGVKSVMGSMAGGGFKMPSMAAENKQTAAVAPETEETRTSKLKRRGASVLTKDWSINLGQPGLLGL